MTEPAALTFRCEAPDPHSLDGRCPNTFPLTHARKRFCCETCQVRAYRKVNPRNKHFKKSPIGRNKLNFNLTPSSFDFSLPDVKAAPNESAPKPVENPAPTGDELFDNWLKKGD